MGSSQILLDKPWNRNLDDIKESILRYNNWKDIKSEIYKIMAYQKSSLLCKKWLDILKKYEEGIDNN